jgi:hypothetical protein
MTDQSLPYFGANATPEVPWTSVMKIWWLVTWRTTVGSLATGMTLGIVISVTGMILGWPPLLRTSLVVGTGSVVVLLWQIVAVRIALQKIYTDLRLNLSRLP